MESGDAVNPPCQINIYFTFSRNNRSIVFVSVCFFAIIKRVLDSMISACRLPFYNTPRAVLRHSSFVHASHCHLQKWISRARVRKQNPAMFLLSQGRAWERSIQRTESGLDTTSARRSISCNIDLNIFAQSETRSLTDFFESLTDFKKSLESKSPPEGKALHPQPSAIADYSTPVSDS